ncbi:class I SAM-dependent DNA methyltransferase [Chryseobacterium sp. NEB161]|nr:class I SAM-dependent DNA methyltransferase [Chryseobacterium sp. NEB161]
MSLNWNEIKDRAVAFSKEWENETREEAEAKSFLTDFFNVFGINRRKFATFEHKVKKLNEKDGYIDLLWKANILVEMKSRGQDLNKAFKQAKEYTQNLPQNELPKLILICDFENFHLYDLETDEIHKFKLKDLVQNVNYFGFLLGYQKRTYKEQDPVNIEAAERMGKLHDSLEDIGYTGHALEVYLVRLLFCLFAEDTSIFNKQQFQDYIERRTSEDGSDLAAKLNELFFVLNTPEDKRLKNLDEQLAEFPYVNGKLFEEMLPPAAFSSKMRQALINCCYLDWSKISPAIFGSMFQSVMNPQERRNLGAHYTSEKNILKLIKPLFLDDLYRKFESVKNSRVKLMDFHKKLGTLKFLDPACGCGNFLVITYRELRLLELEVLRSLYKKGDQVQGVLDLRDILFLNVNMMYGIEYEEFPARIAEVAMWLIDHQMNQIIGLEFGQNIALIPLKQSANILHTNALSTDWETLVPKTELNYILGNPPFVGSKVMSAVQRAEVVKEFNGKPGSGVLDYVSAWYAKAAKYIQNTNIEAAFVSTNSIVQGEQTSILWGELLEKYHIKINFAHRTFKWTNEAKGKAAVYCIIVGFSTQDRKDKRIFVYEDIKGEPHEIKAKNINPYLVDAANVLIGKRTKPISKVPPMSFGNMPLDGGHLLLSAEEKDEFLQKEPEAEKFVLPLISAHEFLNGKTRYCLWLVDAEPLELKKLPEVLKRIEEVRKFRLNSVAPSTQKFAATPSTFRDKNRPESFILIPSTTSENRKYIPMGFFSKNNIANNSCHIVPNGELYHFGILMSAMHMSWVSNVCGRLESRYRYSKDIVYNNFPWPVNPSSKQLANIAKAAQEVLDAREKFPQSSLADLYDPLTMPHVLLKAHQNMDKAVDAAYSSKNFKTETDRMEFLFGLYGELVK